MPNQFTPLEPIHDRFMRFVDQSGDCWLWKGTIDPDGYGRFWIRELNRSPAASRVAYELFVGPVPVGLWVLHRCDGKYPRGDFTYRRCVRPDHLYAGTPKQNTADRERTSRGGGKSAPHQGQLNPHRTLTEADVRAIRQRVAVALEGWRKRVPQGFAAVLATEYGVSRETIASVAYGKTWRHLAE